MKLQWIAGSLVLLAALGCITHTERITVVDRAPGRPVPPPPAPQVMVAPHLDANGQQTMVGNMTEAQRRELLLPAILPFEPYIPAPIAQPEHEYREGEPRSSSGNDYSYRHPDGYDFLTGLARVGLYTAAGAIIGHQWDEKGKGAAIGGGLALLSWPWFGGYGSGGW